MKEVERKYLVRVRECALRNPDDLVFIEQGYVVAGERMEWRVRKMKTIVANPDSKYGYPLYTTSVKFGNGFIRREYEWTIGARMFRLLAKFVGKKWVKKTRASYGEWAVDRFGGDLWPLVVMEREAPVDEWELDIDEHWRLVYKPSAPLPAGVHILRDVTNEGRFAVKRLARADAKRRQELIIDEVADLGTGVVDAECSLYSGVESKEQRVAAIPCGSGCFQ
jgi:CYTH domain-containing protein